MKDSVVGLIVMLLLLVGLVGLVMEVEVDDGTLLNAVELIVLLGVIVVGLIVVGLVAFLLVKGGIVSEKWFKVWEKRADRFFDYLEATPVVLAFGQSDLGKRLYSAVGAVHEQVNDPGDIGIQYATYGLNMLSKALDLDRRTEPVKSEELSAALAAITASLKMMLDGKVRDEVRYPTDAPAG